MTEQTHTGASPIDVLISERRINDATVELVKKHASEVAETLGITHPTNLLYLQSALNLLCVKAQTIQIEGGR